MIIVSRLLLRFFSLRHHFISFSLFLSFLFIPPSKLSNSKFTTGRMTSRDVHPFASRYHFREKNRRKSLFVANRAAANEVRGGWGVVGKIWSRPREKWWKKDRWKFRGQKGRLCFAADCSFFLFFFSLLLPSPGTIFLFLGLENLDRLECFTPRLLQSLASACRSDFHRATNNNKITTLFFLIKMSYILFFLFFKNRRRFSSSLRFFFKEIWKAGNFNINKKRNIEIAFGFIRNVPFGKLIELREREKPFRFYGYKNCEGSCWEVAF